MLLLMQFGITPTASEALRYVSARCVQAANPRQCMSVSAAIAKAAVLWRAWGFTLLQPPGTA
eukprot:80246-Amphidinium_carterae.1